MSEDENVLLKVQFSVTDEFGRIVETTDEEEAKKNGIFNPNAKYGYSMIVLSDNRLIKGFREALVSANENEEKTVKIAKADAFGDRKEELVVLIPMKKFEEANMAPQVGMIVDLDGQTGKVQSVSGGRVRVDMNHELAGRDVVYKFKILKKISSDQEKLDSLLEEQLGIKETGKISGDTAQVLVSQDAMKKDNYLQGKYGAIQAVLQIIPNLKKLQWTEEFTK
ncbi:MAG: peptidylprolyl isomerase [Candidatus Micrarchaeota archaeon]